MTVAIKEKLGIVPLVEGNKNYKQVTEDILKPTESFPTKIWWTAFLIALTVTLVDLGIIGYLMYEGLYILGINNPVGWGFFMRYYIYSVKSGELVLTVRLRL